MIERTDMYRVRSRVSALCTELCRSRRKYNRRDPIAQLLESVRWDMADVRFQFNLSFEMWRAQKAHGLGDRWSQVRHLLELARQKEGEYNATG